MDVTTVRMTLAIVGLNILSANGCIRRDRFNSVLVSENTTNRIVRCRLIRAILFPDERNNRNCFIPIVRPYVRVNLLYGDVRLNAFTVFGYVRRSFTIRKNN